MENKEQDITLKDVANVIRNEEWEELKEITKDISKLVPEPVKIDRQTFEKYLLPYLLMEVERNDENNFIFQYNFLKLTNGSYHREIVVIDENGEVMFLLPPLVLDVELKEDRISISTVIKKFYNLFENHYHGVEKELVKDLNEVVKSLKLDEDVYAKYIVEFNKVFSYYKDRFLKAYKKRLGIEDEEDDDKNENKNNNITSLNKINEEDDIFDY